MLKARFKFMSLLLTITIVLSVVFIAPITVSASINSSSAPLTVNATSNYFPKSTSSFNKDTNQIIVTYNLQSSKNILNDQWTVTYDSKILSLAKENTPSTMCPIKGTNSVIINKALNNQIKGNCTNLYLYDFSKNTTYLKLVFNVNTEYIKTNMPVDTTVNLSIEVLTVSNVDKFGITDESEEVSLVNNSTVLDNEETAKVKTNRTTTISQLPTTTELETTTQPKTESTYIEPTTQSKTESTEVETPTEPAIGDPSKKDCFYFNVNSVGWQSSKIIYCHIYNICNGDETWPVWQSKAEKCSFDEYTGIATYDINTAKTKGYNMNIPSTNSCAIMFSNDRGMETYPIIVNSSCYGDTIYAPDKSKMYENIVDSDKSSVVVKWKNSNLDAKKVITSTGKIQGNSFAEGESDATIMADYMIAYNNQPKQFALVQYLISYLNVSPQKVLEEVKLKESHYVATGIKSQSEADKEIDVIEKKLLTCTDPVCTNPTEATSSTESIESASSVILKFSSLTLGVGESYTLSASVYPTTAKTSLIWNSSNKEIATVDSNAKVTAKKVGTTTITVKTSNGKTSTCKLTVKSAPTSVNLSTTSLTLGKGESYTISQCSNSGSYAKNFTWSSSNKSVATIASIGSNKAKISAKATGTTTITVKTFNGKTSTCKLTVKSAPTSVKLSTTSLTLGKGESYTISQCSNSGSYAKNFTWSSSNKNVASIASVGSNKAKITAKATGTTTITVKTFNGKTSTCKLTVKSAPTSVKLSTTSLTLGKGKSFTISQCSNSGSYAKNFTWSSSNKNVATIASVGSNKAKITAKTKGTAIITVKTFNGKTSTCKVTVK